MNRVFVDTSALIALLSADDRAHDRAGAIFKRLRARNAPLVTTSFVLVETYALLGRRLGLEAVRGFREDFAPLLDVAWVDQELCESGLDLLLERGRRRLSLVDTVSFLVIRHHKLAEVFAFDIHFDNEDFEVLR